MSCPKKLYLLIDLGMSKTSHLLTWFHPVLLSACYSEAKASVPSISNKLGERLVCDFLPRDSSPTEGVTETQFDTRVAQGARMMPEHRILS